jgi:hypothetical protein
MMPVKSSFMNLLILVWDILLIAVVCSLGMVNEEDGQIVLFCTQIIAFCDPRGRSSSVPSDIDRRGQSSQHIASIMPNPRPHASVLGRRRFIGFLSSRLIMLEIRLEDIVGILALLVGLGATNMRVEMLDVLTFRATSGVGLSSIKL